MQKNGAPRRNRDALKKEAGVFRSLRLHDDLVGARGVVRSEQRQHAARLPLLHAVGVEAPGVRGGIQPGVMDLFFQHSFIEKLGLDGRGNVLLVMWRPYAGGNDGDQVRGIDAQEFFMDLIVLEMMLPAVPALPEWIRARWQFSLSYSQTAAQSAT